MSLSAHVHSALSKQRGSFKPAHALSFTDHSHSLGLRLKADAQANVKGMVELRIWDKLRFNGSEHGFIF